MQRPPYRIPARPMPATLKDLLENHDRIRRAALRARRGRIVLALAAGLTAFGYLFSAAGLSRPEAPELKSREHSIVTKFTKL